MAMSREWRNYTTMTDADAVQVNNLTQKAKELVCRAGYEIDGVLAAVRPGAEYKDDKTAEAVVALLTPVAKRIQQAFDLLDKAMVVDNEKQPACDIGMAKSNGLRKVKPGDKITAELWNALIDEIRARTTSSDDCLSNDIVEMFKADCCARQSR